MRRTCSRQCMAKRQSLNRSGSNHPRYKGGTLNPKGYREISVNGKVALEHRFVMSQYLGRPLLHGEIVHHLNGDKTDNRINNLELIESIAAHNVRHLRTFRNDNYKQCFICLVILPRASFPGSGFVRSNVDPHGPYCISCKRQHNLSWWHRKKTTKKLSSVAS